MSKKPEKRIEVGDLTRQEPEELTAAEAGETRGGLGGLSRLLPMPPPISPNLAPLELPNPPPI